MADSVPELNLAAKRAVTQYFDHFESQLAAIEKVQHRLFQKILTLTLVSALARGRYPDERSDRRRFTQLILDYSEWLDARSVSVPQLKLQIARRINQGNTGLTAAFLEDLDKRFITWRRSLESSEIRRSRLDPTLADLSPSNPTAEETKILADCLHVHLLYDFRSCAVHEFREPGYPFELSQDDSSPYYVPTEDLDLGTETAELTYPRRFLLNLARTVMANLKTYYLDNELDPYERYNFGSAWNSR